MKRYSIGQFAKEINATVQTLRNWDHTGKLKPDYVSPPPSLLLSKTTGSFSGLASSQMNKR